MRFGRVLILFAALGVTVPATALAASADRAVYLVTFADGVNPDAEAARLRSTGWRVDHVYRSVLAGVAVELPAAAATALARNPRVALVERDGPVTVAAEQSDPTWGLDRIDQRGTALDRIYRYPQTAGQGVLAYVVDTGVLSNHREFTGRITAGYSAIGGSSEDCNGHGTHVAGTVAGTTYGVAKQATVVPVRVLDCNGSGSWSGVVAGLDWIRSSHPGGVGGVANLSLGGGANSTVDAAVNNLVNSGVTVVVAAGNSNADACSYSPARVADAVTVGATTSTDARASYSNFGSCLDLFAPGSSVTSAWHTSTTSINTISGTSMAAPHVAGAAALMLADGLAAPSEVADRIVAEATSGTVSGRGSGSPDLLVYVSPATTPVQPSLADPAVAAISVTPGGGRWVNAAAVVEAVIVGPQGATAPAPTLEVTGVWYLDGSAVATQRATTDSGGSVEFKVSVRVRTGTLDFCVSRLEGSGYSSVVPTDPICPADLGTAPEDGAGDDPGDDPAPEPIDSWQLQAIATKVKGWQITELRWTATSGAVTISRNGLIIATVNDVSAYRDDIGAKGSGTYVYKVCSNTSCSADTIVSY